MMRPGRNGLAALVAVLTAAACDTPTAPTRVAYDFSSGLDGHVFHWPADRLPVRYWADPADSIRPYVERALQLWTSEFLYGEFRGIMVDDSNSADVIVRVAGAPVPSGPFTDFPARDGVNDCGGGTADTLDADGRLEIPIHVVVSWRPDTATQEVIRCLARVVTHEIGHSLGISAHSPDPNDLMYSFPMVFEPSENDRKTAIVLYHSSADVLPQERAQ